MKTRDLAKVNVLFPPHDAACVKRADGNEAADDGATTGLAASVSPSREGGRERARRGEVGELGTAVRWMLHCRLADADSAPILYANDQCASTDRFVHGGQTVLDNTLGCACGVGLIWVENEGRNNSSAI